MEMTASVHEIFKEKLNTLRRKHPKMDVCWTEMNYSSIAVSKAININQNSSSLGRIL